MLPQTKTKTKTKAKTADQRNQKSQIPKVDAAWGTPPVGYSTQHKINMEFSNEGLLIVLPIPSDFVWVPPPIYSLSRVPCHSKVELGSHWLLMAPAALTGCGGALFDHVPVKVSGASLWQTVVGESPAFTASLWPCHLPQQLLQELSSLSALPLPGGPLAPE